MRAEQDRLLVVGGRIAKAMAKYFALGGSFSAAGRSLLLARSLHARCVRGAVASNPTHLTEHAKARAARYC